MRWTEEEYALFLARQQTLRAQQHPPLTLADEPEASLQKKVVALAKEYSWLCYHTFDSRKSPEGFPDLVLVREVVIFAELKTKTGKPSMEQIYWLETLRRTGQVEVYLWRPDDWPMIQMRLTEPTYAAKETR